MSLGGGWGQAAGHSYVSHLYGLGADQFLEFKVVTADGKLKIANKLSNPDLFWALRGGGGGTWGVVVEATVKAYPSPPVVLHLVSINTTTASMQSYEHKGNGSDAAGFYDAMAYIGSQFPDMVDKGAGGIFVSHPHGFLGGSLMIQENATEAYAHQIWDPVLTKMASFPGMGKWTSNTTVFPTYQDFFGFIWRTVGKTPGAAGAGMGSSMLSQRYGSLFDDIVEANGVPEEHLRKMFTYLPENNSSALEKRAPPKKPAAYKPYTTKGDFNDPTPHGKFPMDNRLMARKHLEGLPKASFEVKQWWGSRYIMEVVAGPATHSQGEDTSVVPAWRKAYMSCYTPYRPPYASADMLRKYAPDSGAYVNEVSLI